MTMTKWHKRSLNQLHSLSLVRLWKFVIMDEIIKTIFWPNEFHLGKKNNFPPSQSFSSNYVET
jgi:hypothetical protein